MRPAQARRSWVGRRGGRSPTHGRDARGALDDGVRRRCGGHGSARSGRETLPTLEPPGPQDVAAGAGRHAMPEAVALGAAAVVGLESALHGVPPRPSGLLFGPSVDLRRRRFRWGLGVRDEAISPAPARRHGRGRGPGAATSPPCYGPAPAWGTAPPPNHWRYVIPRFPHVWTPLWNESPSSRGIGAGGPS
jgi:hypothetical protein